MAETIAIDGPSGAGKSTVAKIIATKLNFKYIDTGAMYRAVTYLVLEREIHIEDEESIIQIADNISIDFSTPDKDGNVLVFVNSRNLTEEIRSVEVDNNVSKVASIPEVREVMLHKQRELAGNNSVVMDGRDIGTRVLPDADLKIFLTATLEERAKRRYYDLVEKEIDIDIAEVKEKIKMRDEKDSNREHSPLKEAEDSYKIISDDLGPEEVANKIISLLKGGD